MGDYFQDLFLIIPPEERLILNEKTREEEFQDKYIIISTDIPEIDGKLSCIIESKNVFLGLNLVQWVIIFLGVISLLQFH